MVAPRSAVRLAAVCTVLIGLLVSLVCAQPPATMNRRRPIQRPRRQFRPPPDLELVPNVVYGTGGGRDLHLNILRPKQIPEEPMPAIVYIHGGGWRGGTNNPAPNVIYARNGYFTAAVEYRLSGEAQFPAQIEDCKAAIRWLRANAEQLHIDPDRIGVWGGSAGGHLVALLGTSIGVKELEGTGGNPEQSTAVQCVLDLFGPSDLPAMVDAPSNIDRHSPNCPETLFLGGRIEDKPEVAKAAGPVTYVDGNEPPFLIFHGTRDMVVPYNQSEILYEALKKVDCDVTFVPVEGAGHGFRGNAITPSVREIDAMKLEFFNKHLKGSPDSD